MKKRNSFFAFSLGLFFSTSTLANTTRTIAASTSVATCRAKNSTSNCRIEFFDDYPGTIQWKYPGIEDISPMMLYRIHENNCFSSEGWDVEQDLIAVVGPPTQDGGAVDINGPGPRALDSILEIITIYPTPSAPFTQEKFKQPMATVAWMDFSGHYIESQPGRSRITLKCEFTSARK